MTVLLVLIIDSTFPRIILKFLIGKDAGLSIWLSSTGRDGKLPELCSRIGSDNLLSGFGPTWRLADGNTDESPKGRLDVYDGEQLKFGFIVVFVCCGCVHWQGCRARTLAASLVC